MIGYTHSPGCHPVVKKHFDFSNDKYAWYWIYVQGLVFNTYDWYIVKKDKNYSIWRNIYCDDKSKDMTIQHRKIHKVVCWKVN